MKIRAKMQCSEVTKSVFSEKAKLCAVYAGDKNSEDNTYAKATPNASLEIQIDNPDAQGIITPGAKFYVDLTPAD